MPNILLSTKAGSLTADAAEKLKRELEALGYKVAHAHMSELSDASRDVRVEPLPHIESPAQTIPE